MSTKVNELTPKVDRYTVTDPDGQLSATEYNVILDAVQRHEAQLVDNDFLRFSEQALDDNDKRQARQNIGVVGEGDYAPKMSVGFADNLIGRGEATAEEFTYRPTNGKDSIEDEVARVTRIKGNSVAWNQNGKFVSYTANGLTFSVLESGELKITGTLTTAYPYDVVTITEQFSFIRDGNHKYFISINSPENVNYGIAGYSMNNTLPFIWYNSDGGVWNGGIAIKIQLNETVDYVFSNPQIIDLTQMFGAGNEPATVEEFYERLPLNVDMSAYNEGEIINLNTEAIKTVGFNQWDEQWETGEIDGNTGQEIFSSAQIRSAGFIKVIPNCTYNIKCPTQVICCAYDADFQYIKYLLWGGTTTEFTTPTNAAYIRFCTYGTTYGGTYNHDICINLSHTGWKNGTYEPYREFTRELPVIKKYFQNGMRRAGNAFDSIEWDSSKQKWVAVQRIGSVDLGAMQFITGLTPGDGIYRYDCWSSNIEAPNTFKYYEANIICSQFVQSLESSTNIPESIVCGKYENDYFFIIVTSKYATLEAFTTAMQGVMLNYELAEPIVTEIEDEYLNFDYDAEDFGTEEALSSVPSAPFSADIIYKFNAVDSIRQNKLDIKALQELVAALQSQVASLQAQENSTSIE